MLPPTQALAAFQSPMQAVRRQPAQDVIAPSVNEASVVATSPVELYSGQYFYTCALGGALACGLTHAFVTPLDLVKCRRQVDPKLYTSIFDGWKKIGKAEGINGLYTGVGPTLIGYSFQG
ncbi:Cu/Pi carrier, partial [Dispira parvispora]